MFDIGFPELLLVSLIALLVIGPKRLPETVRTIMLWLGRLRRSFANIKMEIEQEIGAEEIRKQLHDETIMKELEESRQQVEEAIQKTTSTISDIKQTVANPISNPSNQTELTQTEPTQTEPTQTELTQIEPTQTEPNQTEPNQTENKNDGPKQSESGG